MPVHVEEMTTEVAAFEGEMPLSPQQLDQIVDKVLERQQERELDHQAHRESTMIRDGATPQYQSCCGK